MSDCKAGTRTGLLSAPTDCSSSLIVRVNGRVHPSP